MFQMNVSTCSNLESVRSLKSRLLSGNEIAGKSWKLLLTEVYEVQLSKFWTFLIKHLPARLQMTFIRCPKLLCHHTWLG